MDKNVRRPDVDISINTFTESESGGLSGGVVTALAGEKRTSQAGPSRRKRVKKNSPRCKAHNKRVSY